MRSILIAAALAAGLTVVLGGAAGAADEWGTVKGQVTWGGKSPPAQEKVDVNQNQEHCLSKGDIYKEEFVVGKNGGVKNVFVWLQDASNPRAKLPIHPDLKEVKDKEVVIDQPCCKFEPHALGLRAGQVLVGKNSAPIAHNMHWLGGDDNPGDNKLIPAGGKVTIELVASNRPVQITCDIHRWMKAWVRVFDHPYFAVTDAEGKFEIKNAPAGKYNIVMWQEGVGWVNGGKTGKAIEIPAGKAVEVNEKLMPEEK
jgi:plastocyanin